MDATPDWSMYIIKDLSEPWEVPATGDIGGSSKDNICGLTSERTKKETLVSYDIIQITHTTNWLLQTVSKTFTHLKKN